MKKNFKLMAAALLVVAFAALTIPARAGIGDPQVVMSYTTDTTMFSSTGTNDSSGYTNTAVWVDTTKGSSIAFWVQAYGYSANASNNVTLVVKPAFSSASADAATTAAARIALAPGGTTGFKVVTNVTGIHSPGVQVSLENPASNPVPLTNVVVKVFVKTP